MEVYVKGAPETVANLCDQSTGKSFNLHLKSLNAKTDKPKVFKVKSIILDTSPVA